MTSIVQPLLIGILLGLIQVVAALPWLAVLDPRAAKAALRRPVTWAVALAAVLVFGGALALFIAVVQDPGRLLIWGRCYGAVLELQLLFDFFVILFAVLMLLWPQGAAIALATFREGVRQPLYWLIIGVVLFLMTLSPFIPYFTLRSGDQFSTGDDFKMMSELGYDLIVLAALAFGVFDASIRISDEIEGRTAITVMSKPVSRRQFLLGKYLGILLACLLMTGMLGWVFNWVTLVKVWFDRESMLDPLWVESARQQWAVFAEAPLNFVLGAGLWLHSVRLALPGFVFGFCQVMVLLAIAVALATRFPMVVNVPTCLAVFFLGHLTHVLVQVSYGRFALVNFMARVFDIVLPGLEYFDYGPVVVRDIPLDPGAFYFYLGSVVLYALLYSIIALLLGLILFEDRDLA